MQYPSLVAVVGKAKEVERDPEAPSSAAVGPPYRTAHQVPPERQRTEADRVQADRLAAAGQALPGRLTRSRRRPQRQLSPRRAQELSASRLRDDAPSGASSRGIVSGHRQRLLACFLRWTHCRRPLQAVGAVAFRADFRLSTAACDEALHAGPTEPAALTLRYPLLVRDAVDEPL